MQYIDYEDTEE